MTRFDQQASSGQQHEFGVRRRLCWSVLIGVWAALIILGSSAVAQSTSQLNGSVSDPSGAAVAGVDITLTEAATGLQRTTISNASGLYQFLEVPPGNYKLQASAKGFGPYVV